MANNNSKYTPEYSTGGLFSNGKNQNEDNYHHSDFSYCNNNCRTISIWFSFKNNI